VPSVEETAPFPDWLSSSLRLKIDGRFGPSVSGVAGDAVRPPLLFVSGVAGDSVWLLLFVSGVAGDAIWSPLGSLSGVAEDAVGSPLLSRLFAFVMSLGFF
jgi:hypothetical protein